MKVYLIETVKDLGSPGYDIAVVNISSSFENAIWFIKRALEDSNSGIQPEDEIQITEETVYSYFDYMKFLGRFPAISWVDNYETQLSEERIEKERATETLRKFWKEEGIIQSKLSAKNA